MLANIVYPTYYRIITRIRSNRILAEKLFGLQFPHNTTDPFWDFTTLILKRALHSYVNDGYSILEVGIGLYGILTGYVSKNWSVQISGIDIQEICIQSSRNVLESNHLSQVKIWQSDLFDNVFDTYDIIFFNSVYIKTDWGKKYLSDSKQKFWDGGEMGCETIERFLRDAPRCMNPGAHILLGINNFYIPRRNVIDIIERTPMTLEKIIQSFMNPSYVYILKLRDPKIAP